MSIGGVVITTGPACDNRESIRKMVEAVLKRKLRPVLRLNFAHHGRPSFQRILDVTCEVVASYASDGVLLQVDLPGPKIRANIVGNKDKILLKEGERVFFGKEWGAGVPPNSFGVREFLCPNLPEVLSGLEVGMQVALSDGQFRFQVEEVIEQDSLFLLRVTRTAEELKNNQGVSFPKRKNFHGLDCPTAEDLSLVPLAISSGADIIAQSFTRNADSIACLRSRIRECGDGQMQVMAKPETREGLDALHRILEVSDSLMVPRGDLAVEVGLVELPFVQEMMVEWGRFTGKPVTIGTGLLKTMMKHDEHERSESIDLALAIRQLWGTSGFVMLTNETCEGAYPELAVETVLRTIERTDTFFRIRDRLSPSWLKQLEAGYQGLADHCGT